jgi:hypothetical protein
VLEGTCRLLTPPACACPAPQSDGDINRKRIRSLRKALEPKGWRSVGF